MTDEEKQPLLKDLCSRLPYHPQILISNDDWDGCQFGEFDNNLACHHIEAFLCDRIEIKPYLRPMSSMTEEERKEHDFYCGYKPYDENIGESYLTEYDMPDYMDWLLEHHFDYRGLIPKGLAIEVTEENNPYK